MSQIASQSVAPPTAARPESTFIRRIVAAGVTVSCAALLGVAAWLEPNPAGYGTHHQLVLQPCAWPQTMGIPCPTCGMTTAFAHAANGDLLHSFLVQPMGCILALATAMTLLTAAYVAATGSRLAHRIGRMWGPWAAWSIGSLTLGAWIYKIVVFRWMNG